MSEARSSYVPALRFHALTRFYDGLMAWGLREQDFRRRLVEQIDLRPGQCALDVGCGTGTLTLALKRAAPEATVVGLDADPEALARARHKAEQAGLSLELHEGLASQADLPSAGFDRVAASLFFHHLEPDEKARTLDRVLAWLRPGGELHVADWSRPHDPLMRALFVPVQLLDGFANTADHVGGRFPALLDAAGFEDIRETWRGRTLFGTLALFCARRPT